ncbi:MAG: hypothetical protein HOI95_08985 [Chromatiales bacterium]|nr:hypothetical protein [Chromatiales bacterium]
MVAHNFRTLKPLAPHLRVCRILGAAAVMMVSVGVLALDTIEWSGNIQYEGRYFPKNPLSRGQIHLSGSVAFEPELYLAWSGGKQSLLFKPFIRFDSNDRERTHFDVRELMWQYVGDTTEVRVGVGKVFWGVTEGVHLVDIINQSDLVDSPDGEEKLGQPMVNLDFVQDWGTLSLFMMPRTRLRTFPGPEGRLRTQPRVDTSQVRFDSGSGRNHVDVAGRWSHVFGDIDLAVSHFYGNSREPRFIGGRDNLGTTVLIPLYEPIHQTGLEVQYTADAWLWKLEAIRRGGQGDTFRAFAAGFEYTLYGFAESNWDVGLVGEYYYDDRGETGQVVFQKDMLTALRVALNDEDSTELLMGVISDLDNGSRLYSIEGSRRIVDDWKLSIEGRAWSGVPANDPLFSVRRDNYLQVQLQWYF